MLHVKLILKLLKTEYPYNNNNNNNKGQSVGLGFLRNK